MISTKEGYNHQLALKIPKFEIFDYRNVVGAYMNNLRWLLRRNVVNLEFVMVEIHLNASDYFLKFHMLKLSKLPYIDVGLLILNLRIFR